MNSEVLKVFSVKDKILSIVLCSSRRTFSTAEWSDALRADGSPNLPAMRKKGRNWLLRRFNGQGHIAMR